MNSKFTFTKISTDLRHAGHMLLSNLFTVEVAWNIAWLCSFHKRIAFASKSLHLNNFFPWRPIIIAHIHISTASYVILFTSFRLVPFKLVSLQRGAMMYMYMNSGKVRVNDSTCKIKLYHVQEVYTYEDAHTSSFCAILYLHFEQ